MNRPGAKPRKLPWIKYNPDEWIGKYSELTDEEYGFFHRVIAKLWATPGNRLAEASLRAELRIATGSQREGLLRGLIGYAIKQDEDGLLFVVAIDDAFTEATSRSAAGRAAAETRWAAEPAPVRSGGDF